MQPGGPTGSLHRVLESLSQGILVADRSGGIVLFNDAARRILGAPVGDLPLAAWPEAFGLFLADRITPYPTDRFPLVRAMRGEAVAETEVFVRNPALPDGATLVVSGTPWRDDAGVLRGGIAVVRDISVDRRARDTLERLSNAVEQTADHIIITDIDGGILYVNPAFERLTGYSRDEAYGRTPRLFRSDRHEPSTYTRMWSTLLAGDVFRGTFVNRKRSGELYSSGQTITPMRDDSGRITHFVSVGKDLTEREAIQDRDTELRLAGMVQRRMYPPHPRREGLDIAGAAHPASATGGDYYDFLQMPGERLGIVVADVSGHGLGAALIMVATRAALRSCADVFIDLDHILDRVNDTLRSDLETGKFVTLFLASLDLHAMTLTYRNAGHPSGYVLGADGEVRHVLDSTRIPLGIMADRGRVPVRTLPLEPGDLLLLLTDGILESEGPDRVAFGAERALALVREHRREPAQRILERLLHAVHVSRGTMQQEDDMTAVICRIRAAP